MALTLSPAVPRLGRSRWRRPSIRREHQLEVGLAVALVLVTTLTAFAAGSLYWQQVMLLMDLYIATAVFLNVLRGEAGQTSFGQGAVFGAAAYGVGMASGIYGINFWVSMCIGIGVGTAFAFVAALPSLRIQGYYLGFVTLAAAVVFPALLLGYNDFTQAVSGISVFAPGLQTTTVWGLTWLAIVIVLIASLSFAFHGAIRSSTFGRRLKVAAASPEAAASLGMRPGLLRLAAFGLAGLGTSVCGALYVPLTGFVSPGAFPFSLSILLFFAVVVGGQGSIAGPLLGIYLLYFVPNVLLTDLAQYRLLIYGCTAFVVMVVFPDGIIGFIRSLLRGSKRNPSDLAESLVTAMVSNEVTVRAHVTEAQEPEGQDPEGQDPDWGTLPRHALSVRNISRSFGSVRALTDVTLDVLPGEIHGLVGANGSGKTTLLNVISGLVEPEVGSVYISGVDATELSTRRRARSGLARTFQVPRVFEDMSLMENIHLDTRMWKGLDRSQRESWDRTSAQSLSHGQRRLVELYRVLSNRPSVALLDEPAAGLSAGEREQLARVLTELSAVGVAVLLVEHDLGLVWDVADKVTVMDVGKVARQGSPQELANDDVVALLLGGSVATRG